MSLDHCLAQGRYKMFSYTIVTSENNSPIIKELSVLCVPRFFKNLRNSVWTSNYYLRGL